MLPRREAAFPTGEGGSPQARRMRGNTLSQRAKPGLNHQVSPPHPSRAAPDPPSPAGEGIFLRFSADVSGPNIISCKKVPPGAPFGAPGERGEDDEIPYSDEIL